MDKIKEGQNKKWLIRLWDKTIRKWVVWVGHSPDTKQMILFRMVNLLVKKVNRLEKALGMVARQHSKDKSDKVCETVERLMGNDYLDRR